MYELLIQIRLYLSGMWKYRWLGIAASWAVCLAGWTFVHFMPDQYQSSGKVQADTKSILKPLLKGIAVETDPAGTVSLVTKKLMSRPTLEQIIRETNLGLKVTNEQQMEDALDQLRNKVAIEMPITRGASPGTDQIIIISYTNKDPQLAWTIVKKFMDFLVEDTLGASRSDTNLAHNFLMNQIKDYERRLVESEQKLADFKKQNIGMMPGESGTYYTRLQGELDKLNEIESELRLARNRKKVLESQFQNEIARSATREFDKKIQDHENKLNSLLLQFTHQHPDVQAEKSIIAKLNADKQAVINDAASGAGVNLDESNLQLNLAFQNMKTSLQEAEVNVANLEEQRASQNRRIRELQQMLDTVPEVEAQLARLNRDYEVTKARHAELLTRLESARISSDAEQSSEDVTFNIIDPPVVPLNPVSPDRLLLNTGVLLAGIGAFFGVTFLMLQLRPVFLTRGELTSLTGLPVLGSVTLILDDATRTRKFRERMVMVSLGVVLLITYTSVIIMQRL